VVVPIVSSVVACGDVERTFLSQLWRYLVELQGIEFVFYATGGAIWIIGGNVVRARYRRRTKTSRWSEFITPFTSVKAFLSHPWNGLNRSERLTLLALLGLAMIFGLIGAMIVDARG
jgi:hypothetical protein